MKALLLEIVRRTLAAVSMIAADHQRKAFVCAHKEIIYIAIIDMNGACNVALLETLSVSYVDECEWLG